MIRDLRSDSNPAITAMTTMSAITPTVTPAMERAVISEINARFWRVLRYRPDTNVTNDMVLAVLMVVDSFWR
jgi:hypothetical protein